MSSIPIPSSASNEPESMLPYPVGIADFKELFGKDFNEVAYKKIQFAYYVGELEAKEMATRKDVCGNEIQKAMHDMTYMDMSIPREIGCMYRKVMNCADNEKSFNEIIENGDEAEFDKTMLNAIEWYKKHGYTIINKIYKDTTHNEIYSGRYRYNVLEDMKKFVEDGIDGKGFSRDESSADKLKMNFEKELF